MELCPTCDKEIESLKLLKCKFCEKNFCSLGCLIKHASTHLGNSDSSINNEYNISSKCSSTINGFFSFSFLEITSFIIVLFFWGFKGIKILHDFLEKSL